jgi:aspartate/methionine/tyrosine aminotransferase
VAIPFFLKRLCLRSGFGRFLPAWQRRTDGGAAFLRYASDRTLSAPIDALRDLLTWQQVAGPDAVNLALGSPRFDLVPSSTTKLPADRRGWPLPTGLPELREAVLAQAQPRTTVATTDDVLITHGAAGAFSVAIDAFLNPGDHVVLLEPTSPLFALALRQRRVQIRWLPTWMENGHTRFAIERLARTLRGARMLVFSAPNNPTGGHLNADDLQALAWWAQRRDVLLYCDESFARFQYDGLVPSLSAVPAAAARTLIAGSVSKGHALTSARVGWLIGHRHLIRACTLTQTLQTPGVPTLSQQVALAALRQGDDAFAAVRSEFASRRLYVFERLHALDLAPPWPTGGFFFWVPVHQLGITGHQFAERLLREHRVLVTPGEFFGPSGAGHVRVSCADDSRLHEGLNRLTDFVRHLRGQSQDVRRAA